VSALSFGTMTFGGRGRFANMGSVGVEEATAMVDRCLEAGVNLFDTADMYSGGLSEEVLGQALGKRRDDVLVATKLNSRMGEGPNDLGQSRHHSFVSLQAYYSLVARELEHELVPLCLDQGVGILVWSPLAAGFLSGKFRRGQGDLEGTRRSAQGDPGTIDEEQGFDVVDALDDVAKARGASVPQVALNWLLRRPGVTSVVVGARTLDQLADNLAAASWELTPDEVRRLDEVSARPLPYPYWHQRKFNGDRLVHLA